MAEQDITKTGPVGLKGLKGISAKEEQDIQKALQYSRALRASEATGNVGWENATDAALFSPQHRELDDPLASWGTSKYDTLNTGLDDYDAMNEGRYQNQSTLDALGNALAKMLGTAATTIVSGIANIPVGIYTAIDEGRWSGLWDNELTRGLSEVEDFMEDNFKIYQSKEQQNAPWLSLTNLTSASFWGDDVIKNVGFMLGAAASGSIFTGGLGLAAKALNLVSSATKTSKIGTAILGSMFSAAGEGAIEARQTMESLVDLNNQRLDDTLDRQREEAYARYRETGDIGTYQSTLNDIEAKRIAGKQQILQDARSAGNIDMALNMPILTLGNLFTLGKGFSKSFSNARKMAEASAKSGGADLLNGISDIKNKARKMFQEARTGELKTQLEHTLKNAKWQKAKAFFKPILSEGSEEMNQQWASSLSGYAYDREDPNDYWRARMNPGSQQETMSALTAIGKGFLDSWGDYDQWEQFFVGGLTGAIGMPMPTKAFNQDKTKRKYDPRRYFSWEGGSFQNLREMKEKIDAATKLNEALNTRYKDPKFWNRFDSAVAHSYFQTDMDEGVVNDDIKQYKDAEEKQFVQDLDLAVRSGTVDDFLTFIDASTQNLTDEDIDNIVSRNTVTITKEQDAENQKNTLKRRITSLQQIAEKAIEEGKEAEATEALNQIGEIMGEFNNVVGEEKKIGLFIDSHGNRVKSNDEIRKELESNGKKLKDRVNEYLKSVQYVNSVSGGKLTSDQEGNLAYLHYLGKATRKRANNIMDKAILPLSFTITLDKGETVESLQKILGNGISVTPNEDNSVTIETSSTNKHWRDVILDIALGHDKESTKKNVDELINRNLGFENDILDAISLLNDSREFGITFAKYMKEPERVDEARKKAEQESQQEVENSNVDNKSVQELVEDSDNGKVDLDASEFDFTSEDLTDAEQENLDPERKKEIDRKQKVNTARDIKKTRDTAKEKAKERVIDDDILSSIDAMLDRATSSAEVASDVIDLDTEAFNDPDSLLPTVDEQQLLSIMNDPNSTPEDIEKAKKAYNESRQQRLDEIKNVLSEITKEVVEDLERLKNLPEKGNGAPEVVRTLDSTKSKDPVEAPPTVNKEDSTKEGENTGEEVETPTPNTTNIDLAATSQDTQVSSTQMQDKSYWKSGTTEYPIHRNTENNEPYYEQVKDKKKQAILKSIYDFLRTSGVFTRIRNNEIKVGQKVRFAISKSLSDKIYANSKERVPVLLVVNEDGNILFDLPNPSDTATFGSYTGLAEFYNEVITYYNKNREKVDGDLVIYPNAESTISRPYIGRPLYSAKNERSTLNEIAHGVPFKLGIALTSSPDAKMIMTPGRRRSQGRTEDDQSIVSPESALAGQPYLLIETSDPRRRWVPVPFTMPTFSSDIASSSLYKIIVAHLQKLNDPKSLLTEEAQKEWKRGLKDLLAVSDIFLDVKEVGNNYQVNFRVKVSSTDTAWSTVYRGTVIQNEDITTDIVKTLGGLNIPFQISRKYINTQFNGQDYNSLIGELATTNLESGILHTVNDFYTIDPIIKGKKEGAKSIQDAPREAENEIKASRERNFVRSTIIPDQSNIDRNRTDSNYYYIKESDGKYHKYQRVHNVLPSNSNNTGTANSQRALRTGSAVDTIVRDFFNTGKTTKPDFMSDKAYNSIIEYLKSLDKELKDHKWSVFANNIVLYQKYPDGRRIAGEVDLLFIDNKGNYYIYDVKTSAGPFAGVSYEGVHPAWGQIMSTKEYHTYQVSSYAKLLYDRFGKKAEGVAIVPFTIVYGNNDTVIGVNKVPNIALSIIDVDNYFKKATPQPSEQSTQAKESKPDTSEPRQDTVSARETLKKKAVFKSKKWQARIDRLNDDNILGLSKLKTPILKTLAQYLDAKIIPNMSNEELNNLVAEQLKPKNREVDIPTPVSDISEDSYERMKRDISSFFKNFGITLQEVSEYSSEEPIFDALDRIIYFSNVDNLTDNVGYAIAFMMQWTPEIRELIDVAIASDSPTIVKSIKRSIRRRGKYEIGHLSDKKYKSLDKVRYLKDIGEDIAKELRILYSGNIERENSGYLAKIWKVIQEFFDKLTPQLRTRYNIIRNYTNGIASAIKLGDYTIVLRNDIKPGTTKETSLVNIGDALEMYPYEEGIISTMNSHGIAVVGSASIATQGTLFRPSENPLHDIDFNAGNKTKEQIERILKESYPIFENVNTIREGNKVTETYLIMDRPFTQKKIGNSERGELKKNTGEYAIYDKKTGELLGTRTNSDLYLKEGVQGKMLDFFIGTKEKYTNIPRVYNGKTYIFSDARNAWEAKVSWTREKDIWDYNRYIPNSRETIPELKNSDRETIRKKLQDAKIIWGHPALGKTYYLDTHDDILEWDEEVNGKRNEFIRNQIDPEHTIDTSSQEYIGLKSEYMANWQDHPEYTEFITREWNNLKKRAKSEHKKIFASPALLMSMFRDDFDLFIALPQRTFLERNIQRGGLYSSSVGWKQVIDRNLALLNPNKVVYTTEYFSTLMEDTFGRERYREMLSEIPSETIGKELDILYSVLPQLSVKDRVRIVGTLIKISGGKAWGQFKDGAITLYKNAARGTAYHEAFHFVFNTLMTDQELENAFKSAKRQWGNLSPIELEERMAEDFRRYMQNEETFVGRLKNLWSRLKALLNHFNSNWFYLDRVYTDILKGKYADRDVNTEAIDTIEIKQYHEIKLSYNKLSKEQKDYLSERKISPKEYSDMTILEKEILFHCMY